MSITEKNHPDHELFRLIQTKGLLEKAFEAYPKDEEPSAAISKASAIEHEIAAYRCKTLDGLKAKSALAYAEFLEGSGSGILTSDEHQDVSRFGDVQMLKSVFRDIEEMTGGGKKPHEGHEQGWRFCLDAEPHIWDAQRVFQIIYAAQDELGDEHTIYLRDRLNYHLKEIFKAYHSAFGTSPPELPVFQNYLVQFERVKKVEGEAVSMNPEFVESVRAFIHEYANHEAEARKEPPIDAEDRALKVAHWNGAVYEASKKMDAAEERVLKYDPANLAELAVQGRVLEISQGNGYINGDDEALSYLVREIEKRAGLPTPERKLKATNPLFGFGNF